MKAWLPLLVLWALAGPVQAEVNHCLDSAANRAWVERLHDNPGDELLLNLFALRVGLCEMVRVKMIGLPEATELFEQARMKAVLQRQTEQLESNPKRPV